MFFFFLSDMALYMIIKIFTPTICKNQQFDRGVKKLVKIQIDINQKLKNAYQNGFPIIYIYFISFY